VLLADFRKVQAVLGSRIQNYDLCAVPTAGKWPMITGHDYSNLKSFSSAVVSVTRIAHGISGSTARRSGDPVLRSMFSVKRQASVFTFAP